MIDFYRAINGLLKSVPYVLRNIFFSGDPRKKKKLKARILRSHIKLSLAKLLSSHGITVTCNCHVFVSRSVITIRQMPNHHSFL